MRIRVLVALLLLIAAPAQASYEGFVVPNSASATFSAQARLFSQDLEILSEGLRGNGVVYAAGACQVTPQGSPNMTVHVAACTIVRESATASVSAADPTISAADGSNPRIDIVSANVSGTLVVTAGTAAASPAPPAIPQSSSVNNIVLAFVYVPAASTAVAGTQITDKRVFVNTPGSGGASTSASFVTKVAEAGLSNEFALGSLANGLLLNTTTTGVPTIYAGASCSNQFPRSLDASGAATCATVANADLANSAITINGTSVSLGGTRSLTLASSDFATQGTTTTVLHGAAAGNPSFGAVVSGDLNITTTSCTNQAVTAISSGGVGTCSSVANAMLANSSVTVAGTSNQVDVSGSPVSLGGTVTLSTPQSIHTAATPTFASQTLTAASSLTLGTASTNAGGILLKNATNSNTVTLQSGVSGSNFTLTLPTAQSSGTQAIVNDGSGNLGYQTISGGGDFSSNTATSVDGEVVLFSGTGGKTGKRSTATGVSRLASGVQSAAELSGDVTTSGSNATTLANIPTGVAMAGSLLATAITAPGTPAAGKGSIYVDSTAKNLAVKDDAGVVKHGVQSKVCTSGDFVSTISDAGLVTCTTPAGGGAPTGASYVTLGTDGTLSAERVLTAGTSGPGITLTDAGAGSTITVDIAKERWGVVTSDVVHAQSSQTLTDVTGLSVSICAASTEVWSIDVRLLLTATSGTPDYKWGWTFPTGVTMKWSSIDNFNAPAAGGTPAVMSIETDIINMGSGNSTHAVAFAGWVTCSSTSGTLQLQFAQVTSHASDLTVKKGSRLVAIKVVP